MRSMISLMRARGRNAKFEAPTASRTDSSSDRADTIARSRIWGIICVRNRTVEMMTRTVKTTSCCSRKPSAWETW